MSVQLYGNKHISVLVQWYGTKGQEGTTLSFDEINELALLLKEANLASHTFRYGQTDPMYIIPFEFVHGTMDIVDKITPVEILKAVIYLDYQCCDPDDYEKSEASELLEQIEAAAIRNLPGYNDTINFTPNNAGISQLVQWYGAKGFRTNGENNLFKEELIALGALLKEAYNKVTKQNEPFEFIPDILKSCNTPEAVLKRITSLEEQCSNLKNWRFSEANRATQKIKMTAIRSLDGYDKAPMEIE